MHKYAVSGTIKECQQQQLSHGSTRKKTHTHTQLHVHIRYTYAVTQLQEFLVLSLSRTDSVSLRVSH